MLCSRAAHRCLVCVVWCFDLAQCRGQSRSAVDREKFAVTHVTMLDAYVAFNAELDVLV